MSHTLAFIGGLGETASSYTDVLNLVTPHPASAFTISDLLPAPQEFSFQRATRRLAEILDRDGVTSVTVVGSSVGAKVALDFAVANPNLVAGVVTVGLPVESSQRQLKAQRRAAKFLPKSMLPMPEGYDKKAFARLLEATNSFDVEQALVNLQVPLLALYGEKDSFDGPNAERTVALATNSEYRAVSGGHFLAKDNAEALAQVAIEVAGRDEL